ncbi:hypothetical protein M427DRAFT_30537 [Gonapodya prolifera JEL478]|uniref:Uncharacterized protein n=1 Tax=Gonapodya prolifera (strain JEL478) TaxID=1344416 RepID=A0A139AKT5_GONPJ|nr:hypothetical protein M427DRAFT_30537 [Gonapodya prolifera JEL478]|eukprot:KXS17412.1 hypothetical protein M427DRAFT_30537 [Gonapodya prolifera JEL478]
MYAMNTYYVRTRLWGVLDAMTSGWGVVYLSIIMLSVFIGVGRNTSYQDQKHRAPLEYAAGKGDLLVNLCVGKILVVLVNLFATAATLVVQESIPKGTQAARVGAD